MDENVYLEALDSIIVLEDKVAYLQSEIDRLKSGDFTEQEFQNLCHKFSEEDEKRFKAGCLEYQNKLFGDKND